ncbi:hypothetical protein DICPUDRAFT_83923 [Dictyostelium purpureum]|uniref:RNase III domain-containing protein n=1 Tax=Dictyostelium purpureum TaxID=5786 RepID=F1A123_DICPU|nr:uncharacterized protein DICPUDRAFT_83923 [Dictyostelium purpureum]EGC30110.1 hypothetical protein DICPUDRAFT_83923 [Dictyostelium purpureum]|eukprot:XP_003293362.1 hypothetical protein DICPUDRAFT_83923 [Dictyostelium purpureum]
MSINFHSSIQSLKERGILKICFLPKSQFDKFQVSEFHGDVTLSYQISTFLLNYKPFFTPHLLTELRSLSSSNQILSDFFKLFEIQTFISTEEVQEYSTKSRADVIEAMISELSQSSDPDAQLLLKSIIGFLIGWGERDFNLKYPHIIEEGILKKPKSNEKPKAIVTYVVSPSKKTNSSSPSYQQYNDVVQNYQNHMHYQTQSNCAQQKQQVYSEPQKTRQTSKQFQQQQQTHQSSPTPTFIPLLTPYSIESSKIEFEKSREEVNMYDSFSPVRKSCSKKESKKDLVPYFGDINYSNNNNNNNNNNTNNGPSHNNFNNNYYGNYNNSNNSKITNLLSSTTLSSGYSSNNHLLEEENTLLSPYSVELALNAQQRSKIN